MDSTTDTVQEAALEFNPDEPTAYETGVETIERMLRDISNTTITPTSAVVDVLLDLRTILGQMDDAVATSVRLWMNVTRRLDYYAEMFGEHTPAEDWIPAWRRLPELSDV